MIGMLINTALDLYKLLVIAYGVIGLLRLRANRWTEMLRSVVEPVIQPVRVFLCTHLPREWQVMDFSVIALYLLIGVVQLIVRILL